MADSGSVGLLASVAAAVFKPHCSLQYHIHLSFFCSFFFFLFRFRVSGFGMMLIRCYYLAIFFVVSVIVLYFTKNSYRSNLTSCQHLALMVLDSCNAYMQSRIAELEF
ncbi:hypothetical protein PRUPE_6G184900 [Prunus persica]|uniref:Uncharacterized protein n=1 Tax=Prunus persica TaxID=3760 RepID=A0A251NSE7_PRUPE|nr:hypothetical protein PRUPE_6G184900 [Prunus persica]